MSTLRKKLCFVVPAHYKAFMGGSQYQAKCIINALLKTNDYEITYLARRIDSGYQPPDYNIQRISEPSKAWSLGFFIDTPHLMKLFQQLQPDVIYQRVACAYTGVSAYYSKKNQCKMIWHIAHDSDVTPKAHVQHMLNPASRYIEKKFLEYGIRNAKHIIAQTRKQGELLEHNYGRVVDAIMPNFHPIPNKPFDKSGKTRVVWVANFKPWKQPEVFVRLAKALEQEKNVELLMIGSPPSENSSWGAQIMNEIRNCKNLIYLGKRSQEEVNSILSESHIFVNTSIHEGFANTFIQAWMRRVPVVSLCVNPDSVFNTNKIGFHSGSFEKLLKNVSTLINDGRIREEYGINAEIYAKKYHSDNNVRTLIDIIES